MLNKYSATLPENNVQEIHHYWGHHNWVLLRLSYTRSSRIELSSYISFGYGLYGMTFAQGVMHAASNIRGRLIEGSCLPVSKTTFVSKLVISHGEIISLIDCLRSRMGAAMQS